jgi:plastocyanin
MLSMIGCGGGASTIATVTYRPSRPEVAAEAAAAPEEGTAAPGGATESAVVTGGFGNLKGKVVFQGDFTTLPPLYAQNAAPKDPAVCGIEAAPNETIVVNDGGLANVFIYLAKLPKGVTVPPPGEPIVFDQRACVFKPHVLVVQTGQEVKVLNDDAVAHNTHTYPKRNSSFSQTVAPSDRAGISLKYGRPESLPFQVGCDIHPWMIAYHLAVDHPWATASGADGTFEIKGLPSGKHEFKVWHEKGGELEKALSVVIKPDETAEIEIVVPAAKLAWFEGPAVPRIQLSSTR